MSFYIFDFHCCYYLIIVRTAQKWFKTFEYRLEKTILILGPIQDVDFNNGLLKSVWKLESQLIIDQIAKMMDSVHRIVFRHSSRPAKFSSLVSGFPL